MSHKIPHSNKFAHTLHGLKRVQETQKRLRTYIESEIISLNEIQKEDILCGTVEMMITETLCQISEELRETHHHKTSKYLN